MKNDDVALIQRILTGDQSAFESLLRKYRKQVHTHAWRRTGDFHIAEDIVQDTFLQVYQKLHTLEDPTQFSRWLHAIVNRLCIAWHRKNRVQTEPIEEILPSEIQTEAYSQYVAAEHAKTTVEVERNLVKKLLNKLKECDREVITLHYLEEMTSSEIGTYLGVSENTIKSRIRRARQRLKKYEFMIQEELDITIEREQSSQQPLKGDIIMAKEVKDETKVKEIHEESIHDLTGMQVRILPDLQEDMAKLREQIHSLTIQLNEKFDIPSPHRTERGVALKTLSTLPEDAKNQISWGYVGAYHAESNTGKSRIAYWTDSLDIFLNKAPDANIVNLASLFTDPTIVAIFRQLVEGEKSVEDLVNGTGISETDIEKALIILTESKLVSRSKDNLIKPINDAISFFFNFVSMTIVHLGHIKPE